MYPPYRMMPLELITMVISIVNQHIVNLSGCVDRCVNYVDLQMTASICDLGPGTTFIHSQRLKTVR